MAILNALPGAIAQGFIWGIMAIGLYISYKILDFADLTVDGSICTGACVCGILITIGVNPWLALLVAFIAGLGCGLVTGLLNTLMGIPPILSGILTQLILWTVNLKILDDAANLVINPRKFNLIISSFDITKAILISLAFAIVIIGLLYVFFGTEIGRAIRATGSNPKMAKAQGINTKLCKIIGLMLSNGIVALSGGLLAQYQGFADVTMGRGAIVIGLAAIIIGGAVFSGVGRVLSETGRAIRKAGNNSLQKAQNANSKKRKNGKGIIFVGEMVSRFSRNFAFKLLCVLVGGMIYFIVYQVVFGLGLDPNMLKMLSAVIVAIFLAIPYWQKKLKPYFKGKGRKIGGKHGDGGENNAQTSADAVADEAFGDATKNSELQDSALQDASAIFDGEEGVLELQDSILELQDGVLESQDTLPSVAVCDVEGDVENA